MEIGGSVKVHSHRTKTEAKAKKFFDVYHLFFDVLIKVYVQLWSKHRVATPCFNYFAKMNPIVKVATKTVKNRSRDLGVRGPPLSLSLRLSTSLYVLSEIEA